MGARYQNAFNQAIRYLSTREHSRYELTRKLDSKGYEKPLIEQVLNALVLKDYQSDERFAEVLVRSRTQKGKGRLLIEQEMKEHHVLEYAHLLDKYDFNALCIEIAHKKYGEVLPSTTKEKQKCMRFLNSRGFTFAEIRSIFA